MDVLNVILYRWKGGRGKRDNNTVPEISFVIIGIMLTRTFILVKVLPMILNDSHKYILWLWSNIAERCLSIGHHSKLNITDKSHHSKPLQPSMATVHSRIQLKISSCFTGSSPKYVISQGFTPVRSLSTSSAMHF